ncbi:MAG TPA: DNA circularization N-terminal domain-containing protein [Methylophilaceae bacterium]|nr:DNA circularization N-terminal domain-containing protein [Methylophilaceae bacterium]
MADIDNLLDASFRGMAFDILSTTDTMPRATSEHKYPYVDGDDIEDLGFESKDINIEAIFFGDDYETRLKQFLKLLAEPGAGDLIHPIFGLIKAQVSGQVSISKAADDVDQVHVTVTFKPSIAGAVFFDRVLPIQKAAAVSQSIQKVRENAGGLIAKEVGKLTAFKTAFVRLQQLRTTMNDAISSVRSQIAGVTLGGLDVLGFPLSWANDVSSLVSGIVDLRGFDPSNLSSDWKAVFGKLSSPVKYTAQPSQPKRDQAIIATHVSTDLAVGKADAAQLVLSSEAEIPTLSAPEIETMVNAARTDLEAVILQYRALYTIEDSRPVTEALKTTSLNLQEAARAIIQARPPLITRRMDAPGNLRLIAHKLYADHTRATELWRLNSELRMPNYIDRGDLLNVYAR